MARGGFEKDCAVDLVIRFDEIDQARVELTEDGDLSVNLAALRGVR